MVPPPPPYTLNNGIKIPAIAFGTWGGLSDVGRAAVQKSVLSALQIGYRHIDCAWIYKTDKYVGQAIRESGVPREEIFITTKLSWLHQGSAERVERGFQDELKNLGVDYVDLYLLHWPHSIYYESDDVHVPKTADGEVKLDDSYTFSQSWAALEQIYASGRAKAIGVSNFSEKTLEELLKTAKIVPAVNQVELHPYLAQPGLKEYCDKKGIHLTAYTPTGLEPVREDLVLHELAAKYNASPVQVTFAWHFSRGVCVCTASSQPERQKQSLDLPVLEKADIERINQLDRNQRIWNGPDENGKIFGWSMERMGW